MLINKLNRAAIFFLRKKGQFTTVTYLSVLHLTSKINRSID